MLRALMALLFAFSVLSPAMAQETAQTLDIEHKIDDLLLESRRIFIGDGVDNDSAKAIMRRLWYLELKEPGKPILLVINSPGGSVDAGFAIWDQIKMITSPVTCPCGTGATNPSVQAATWSCTTWPSVSRVAKFGSGLPSASVMNNSPCSTMGSSYCEIW